ncbi:MAG: 5'-nucleotidase C-terminal domain-containing protein [Flavobacteriales bacterium]|nr:5'-nucleotidase C-terminal domain-containing protein [Flavobacteriales bacterium]
MNKLFTYLLITTLSFLLACSPSTKYVGKNSTIAVDSTLSDNQQTTYLIKPYKEKLDAEMNTVLVISAEEFPKEKGKPETKLGNLVADLSLEIATQLYGDSIDFCLLNFGGLRTSLPKGEITKGKIFELMPFENELVVITITEGKLIELIKYLKLVGGQPISGFEIILSDKTTDEELKQLFSETGTSEFKILTSDYLAGGGDKMNFFLNPIKTEKVGIKLRDAIIQYCIQENAKGNQLTGKLDGRITFE